MHELIYIRTGAGASIRGQEKKLGKIANSQAWGPTLRNRNYNRNFIQFYAIDLICKKFSTYLFKNLLKLVNSLGLLVFKIFLSPGAWTPDPFKASPVSLYTGALAFLD